MLLVCMILPVLSWWMYFLLWTSFGVHIAMGKLYLQSLLISEQKEINKSLMAELSKIEEAHKKKQNKKNKDD